MQDVQTTLPIGTVLLGRYEVQDLLGKGGFGAVYLVKDQRVKGNLFALKELVDPDKKERARFTFEGEVLKRLDHPALPRVYRVFEDEKNNRAYMLMDYIEGPNLEQMRQRWPEKRLPLPRVMMIMAPIVNAVNYLHHLQPPIIHRDIKPANIIVPPEGDNTVLVDFGIAKEYNKDATTTAVRRCSPGYGAPEQYARGTNPQTDVYGLAATFYVLLTGLVPADALYRMTRMGSKNVDPLEPVNQLVPEIPQHVSDAIQHAMAINSRERYASVEEFWQALNAESVMAASAGVPDHHPISDSVTPPIENTPTEIVSRPPRERNIRKRSGIVLLFVSLALFALIAGVVLSNSLLSNVGHRGGAAPHPVVGSHPGATATGSRSPAQPSSTPTAAPTVRPKGPPTTTAGGYPGLAAAYQGSLTNQGLTPPVTASMTLSNIRQSGGSISGYFTVGPQLSGSGNFTGNVTRDKKLRFLVAGYNGNLPLLFTGQINADGSLSGQYCSSENGQCNDNAGGHGVWRVTPGMPGSSSSIFRPYCLSWCSVA